MPNNPWERAIIGSPPWSHKDQQNSQILLTNESRTELHSNMYMPAHLWRLQARSLKEKYFSLISKLFLKAAVPDDDERRERERWNIYDLFIALVTTFLARPYNIWSKWGHKHNVNLNVGFLVWCQHGMRESSLTAAAGLPLHRFCY